MARITRSIRQTFFHSALTSIPRHDYASDVQQIVEAACMKKLPVVVRTMYEVREARDFVLGGNFCVAGFAIFAPWPEVWELPIDEAQRRVVEEISAANRQAVNSRRAFLRKLAAIVESCRTTQELAVVLPHFAKHISFHSAPAECASSADSPLFKEARALGYEP